MPGAAKLDEYARKRDFSGTPEPRPRRGRRREETLAFVIQKHDASHLHYDFRLELGGTLKSWAVPKGPCLDPSVRRLAIEVEDHPLDYADFEGHIPEGHYGAGDVIVWDHGYWTPEGDPEKGLAEGHLKFELHGEKLGGSWSLVRTQLRGRQPQWFLIKGRDALARDFPQHDVLAEQPQSVISGRPLPAEAGEHPGTAGKPHKTGKPHERKGRLPEQLSPQLATLLDAPPPGDWRYEIKLDGYRILARIDHGEVRLLTRNGHDWTRRLPRQARALAGLALDEAWLDGELVVTDDDGRPDFQRLQNAFDQGHEEEVRYVLFDLLWLDGEDLRRQPLETRREALRRLMQGVDQPLLRFSEELTGEPQDILAHACRLDLEGLIGKRAGSTYQERRSRDWIKLKCKRRQEFVIVGFSEPKGTRRHIGALLLGLHDEQGRLRYAGKVGTGFSAASLAALHKRLLPLRRERSALDNPPRGREAAGVTWLTPKLLGEVAFAEITRDGIVRQAVFQGLREDKPAREITTEQAQPAGREDNHEKHARSGKPLVRGVRISNPQRVIDPDSGATKLEVAEYYERASERILPWLAGRPVSLLRAPDGIGGELFFQRHASQREIPGVRLLDRSLDPGHEPLLCIDSAEALAGVAQMGTVELHTWNATADRLERPDRFVLDLDPDPELPWARMLEATRLTLVLLDELGLRAFLKTSGGKGMHLLVPLQRRHGWDEVKGFAEAITRHMAALMPDRISAVSGPKNRVGRIFIDYLRNGRSASTVCAWSLRARPGLPVSVPVAREELDEIPAANAWNIHNVAERLELRGRDDPWDEWKNTRQSLTRTMRRQLGLED